MRLAPLPNLQWAAATVVVCLTASSASGAPPPKPAPAVDCGSGGTISGALASGAKIITVRGTCTENVTITQDDVTIQTDGAIPATVTASDPTRATVLLDGARRIVINGVGANGITITGGTNGLSAIRGASIDISKCVVQGNSSNGVVAAYGSTLTMDGCTVQNNSGNGATAANGGSLVVTNSTIQGNSGSGIVSTRSSYARVGQDLAGSQSVKAVTITNNVNGIVVTENAAGTILGGSITGNTASGIFVGRGSSALVGQSSGPLVAGVTIQTNLHGISVEGGNATVLASSVSQNTRTGIIVTNAGSARIGILNDNSAYSGNTISSNGSNGIHVAIGASAFIGGNLISGNGTDTTAGLGRFGIGVFQASAVLAGNNSVQGNAATGVFARAGSVFIGDPNFGLPTQNSIASNGHSDPTQGGIFAFQGAAIQVRSATISGNAGAAVQAFENGIVELRASTVTTSGGGNGGPPTTSDGIFADLGSVVRLRDSSSVISSGGDGAQIGTLSSLDIAGDPTPATLRGNGVDGVGVRCSGGSTLTGAFANVSGTVAQTTGCFPTP